MKVFSAFFTDNKHHEFLIHFVAGNKHFYRTFECESRWYLQIYKSVAAERHVSGLSDPSRPLPICDIGLQVHIRRGKILFAKINLISQRKGSSINHVDMEEKLAKCPSNNVTQMVHKGGGVKYTKSCSCSLWMTPKVLNERSGN